MVLRVGNLEEWRKSSLKILAFIFRAKKAGECPIRSEIIRDTSTWIYWSYWDAFWKIIFFIKIKDTELKDKYLLSYRSS